MKITIGYLASEWWRQRVHAAVEVYRQIEEANEQLPDAPRPWASRLLGVGPEWTPENIQRAHRRWQATEARERLELVEAALSEKHRPQVEMSGEDYRRLLEAEGRL